MWFSWLIKWSRKNIFKNIHTIDVSLMEEITCFAIQKLTVVEKVQSCQDLDYGQILPKTLGLEREFLGLLTFYSMLKLSESLGGGIENKLSLISYKCSWFSWHWCPVLVSSEAAEPEADWPRVRGWRAVPCGMRLASVRTCRLQFSCVTGDLADFPRNMLHIPTHLSVVDVWNGFRSHPRNLKALFCQPVWVSEETNNWAWASWPCLKQNSPPSLLVVGLRRHRSQGEETHHCCHRGNRKEQKRADYGQD